MSIGNSVGMDLTWSCISSLLPSLFPEKLTHGSERSVDSSKMGNPTNQGGLLRYHQLTLLFLVWKERWLNTCATHSCSHWNFNFSWKIKLLKYKSKRSRFDSFKVWITTVTVICTNSWRCTWTKQLFGATRRRNALAVRYELYKHPSLLIDPVLINRNTHLFSVRAVKC